eukprot:CCRYP_001808-RA/>CCRYP_001808-RA protein AED:0.02 eAED:0.02 QI:136/1/1/1/1/1/4/2242/969
MQASTTAARMKLHPEQCQNLPFPVGCHVWYDLRPGRHDDGGVINGGIGADPSGVDLESTIGTEEYNDILVKKWGYLLDVEGSASTSVAAESKDTKDPSHQTMSFSSGFVSGAYLDLAASTILYEVTPIANSAMFDDSKKSFSECKLFLEKELVYCPGSLVHVIPHDISDKSTCAEENLIPGEVLLCRLRSIDVSADTSNTEATKEVIQIKTAFAKENHRIFRLHKPPTDSQHVSTIMQLLQRLHTITMDNETLMSTNIGASISTLKSYENGEVARLASLILEKWRAVKNSDDLLKKVLVIKQTLAALSVDSSSDQPPERQHKEIISALHSLNNITVNLKTLKKTRIGMIVSKLKVHTDTTISMMANDLIKGWKAIASKEEQMSQPINHEKTHTDESYTYVYTIKVLHDDGCFHVENDVSMDRFKYRHDDNQPTPLALSGPTSLAVAKTTHNHCFSEDRVDISNANAAIDQCTCPLASPSTLTVSDTTPDQSSQGGMYKRKPSFFDDQEKRLEQSPKRSCSKRDAHFAASTPTEQSECERHIVTNSNLLHSSDHYNEEDGVSLSTKKDSRHALAETSSSPYTKNTSNCVKIPIRIAHISHILGPNGEIVQDIQRKTGCIIDIRGKGHIRRGFETSNEPLHAKITGDTHGAIEAARGMIRAIIHEIDGCSSNDPNEAEAFSIEKSSPERTSVIELNKRQNSSFEPLDQTNNGVIGSTNLKSVYCRLYFPPWLVYDDPTKARLHHYLQNNVLSISRIGFRTKCTIEIGEWKRTGTPFHHYDPTHLFIQSNDNSSFFHAKLNISRAKEDVENILIGYIHNDGSKGRLFYDMAISCSFLHGYITENSKSVHQRNPFSDAKNREYIDVVELPYFNNPTTNSKEFSGHFLICKHAGILREVRHRTGCTIKICGDMFNVPVKYCDPYVFVYGEEKHRVDEAVNIIVNAIKDKLRTSSDLKWKEDGEHRFYSLKIHKR